MAFQILKRAGGALLLITSFIFLTVVVSVAQQKPAIRVSESTLTAKKTNTIKVTGSGFTPNTVVTIGVEGIAKRKHVTGSKNLWLGLAKVNLDRKFAVKLSLRNSLWRVKGLSGSYTLIAQSDLDEIGRLPIMIKPASKKAKKKK